MKKLLLFTILFFNLFIVCNAQSIRAYREQHSKLLANQARIYDHVVWRDYLQNLHISNNTDFFEHWDNHRLNPYSEFKYNFSIDLREYVNPVKTNVVNSHYGFRPSFGRNHYGVDLKASTGDTIYTSFDGKVRITKFDRGGYGFYIVIRHTNGVETLYGHLSRFLVKSNEIVRSGQPIALSGNTGRSTGPHLHYEIRYMGRALDPEKMINFETHTPKMASVVVTDDLMVKRTINNITSTKTKKRKKRS